MYPSAHSLDEAWISLEPPSIRRSRGPPPSAISLPALPASVMAGVAPASVAPASVAPASVAPASVAFAPDDGRLAILMELVLKALRLAREESERKHQTLLLAACLLLAGMVILMDRTMRRTPAASAPSA